MALNESRLKDDKNDIYVYVVRVYGDYGVFEVFRFVMLFHISALLRFLIYFAPMPNVCI